MDDLLGLRDRVAIVVGAGRGIGRSSALLLARAGCHVALVDIDEAQANALAEEVRVVGREAIALHADVTVLAEAADAVAQTVAALGRVDVLANIVGRSTWVPLLEMESSAWADDLRDNLVQHFNMARPAAARMIEQGDGGSIVSIASVSGLFAAPRHAAYGAAKAGLVALVKSMAHEWAEHRIRVNAVAPGGVLTERFQALIDAGTANPDAETMARLAEPDDIGGAVLMLSSVLARKVTGQTLVVDGGSSTASPFGIS
jgi:NAD(P)-dependent dehydrogenase (short-subunit alcohol dehydrogenase family)